MKGGGLNLSSSSSCSTGGDGSIRMSSSMICTSGESLRLRPRLRLRLGGGDGRGGSCGGILKGVLKGVLKGFDKLETELNGFVTCEGDGMWWVYYIWRSPPLRVKFEIHLEQEHTKPWVVYYWRVRHWMIWNLDVCHMSWLLYSMILQEEGSSSTRCFRFRWPWRCCIGLT